MKHKLLGVAVMAVMMLAIVAIPLMAAETENSKKCTTDKDCWDKHYNCYYECSNNACKQITSLIPVRPHYPDCGSDSVQTSVDDLNENESINGLKMGWRNVEIWFTFNQEKKAEKELDLARLELIRAKIAAKNDNSVAMEKALDAHQKILDRVEKRVGKVKLTGLERAIQVHEARIAKMNEILANANLTAEQKTKIEAKITKATNVTAKLSELNNEKKEKAGNATGTD